MSDIRLLLQEYENRENDNKHGVSVKRQIKKELSNLKKYAERPCSVTELPENTVKWFCENYPRLEECVRGDIRQIPFFKRVYKYYSLFCNFTEKIKTPLDEDAVRRLFCFVNERYNPSLSCSGLFTLLLRCAVCSSICRAFLDSFENTKEDASEKIERLFVSLDNLLSVDEEAGFSGNRTENVLLRDPAGLYCRLSKNTRMSYRYNLERLARKRKISEIKTAERIVAACSAATEDERKHIGAYLCDKPACAEQYVFLLFFLSCLFTLLLCLASPFFVLSFFSVYGCAKLILNKFFSKLIKPYRLPRVEIDKIPDNHGVLCVTATLLTGRDEGVFERLEDMYFSNGGENVYFGILADLRDSDKEWDDEDEKIVKNANLEIRRLRQKYGDVFFLFVRRREYSCGEGAYMAHERKRGAVGALCSLLCNKGDVFCDGSIKPDEKKCSSIKYVLTLDADTNPAFDCIKKLVGIMLHPQNEPVVDEKNSVVVKGFGILQPRMNTTLDSAMSSFFTRFMCGHGGIDSYSTAEIDGAMPLFGRSIFCGKGMFEKNCFYKTLCGNMEFEHNSVLSHDAPEGARLRCAYVSDVSFTDSFPREELSYYKRLHRWIRGDVQNIPFLLSRVKNVKGERIKNKIGLAPRFFMWENIYSAFLPVFTLLSVFCAMVFENEILYLVVSAALTVYVLPFLRSVLWSGKKLLLNNSGRIFYSRGVYGGVFCELLKTLFNLASIPKSAEVSADAVFRALFRMYISHKKMLEWTTSAQNDAEKNDGLLGYVRKNLFSAVCAAVLFVFSRGVVLRLLALLWMLFPVMCYLSSKNITSKKAPLMSDVRERLLKYTRDTWSFFERWVNADTNYLPPDNISFYPVEKTARMTSPTNIGLYLLSVASAYRLGFVDRSDMYMRLEKCLDTVESLEKHEGLLFNWYDVFTKTVMEPKYLSSVDIGNYAACLYALKGELLEETEDDEVKRIADRIEKMLSTMNIEFLYNKKRKLFYIGALCDKEKIEFDRNCYDMLMSEARLLSYVATASRRVEREHYERLSRRFTEGRGYLGICSWSGTVFEYFMPEIFLETKEGSLVYEALHFAYESMKEGAASTGKKSVFGISESCYNELDRHMNYKYFAFGREKMALSTAAEQKVISPYSSFLMLEMSPSEVVNNLCNLEKIGAYGKFGFWESVDFERGDTDKSFGIVRCVMSHHAGMSICAAANLLDNGRVRRWFYSDKKMHSAYELNEEKIPYSAYVEKTSRKKHKMNGDCSDNERCKASRITQNAEIGTELVGVCAGEREITMRYGDFSVIAKPAKGCRSRSFEAFVFVGEERVNVLKGAVLKEGRGKIVYENRFTLRNTNSYTCTLSFTAQKNTSHLVRVRLALKRLSGEGSERTSCLFCFVPSLERVGRENFCPVFSDARTSLVLSSGNDAAHFFNRESSVHLFADVLHKNKFCEGVEGKTKNERTVAVGADMVQKGSLLENELVLSLSHDRRCAEMGIVRSTEQSFDETCERLYEYMQKSKNSASSERMERAGVLSAAVSGKAITPVVSPNPLLGEYHLLSSDAISFFVSREGMLFSFVKNVNSGRITEYPGAFEQTECSERLLFGDEGFDLCKNAELVSLSPCRALYRGKYKQREYEVTCFAMWGKSVKLVAVETCSDEKICFSVTKSRELSGKNEISSGFVFFSDDEKHPSSRCFVYGYCEQENGQRCGARYECRDRINAFFVPSDNNRKKYVFAVGAAEDYDTAYEYEGLIKQDLFMLYEQTQSCTTSLFVNTALMTQCEKLLLTDKPFPFSDNALRCLVDTDCAIFFFDVLLLSYTSNTELLREKLECGIEMLELQKSGVFLVAAFCNYILRTKDFSFADKKLGNRGIYGRVLSFASETLCAGLPSISKEERMLYELCLEKLSETCELLGDVRMAAIIKTHLEKKTKNGVNCL